MAKLPRPPAAVDLARIAPEWKVLPAGTALFRIYARGGAHPARWNQLRTFGPVNARFDHHRPPPHDQDRGIMYLSQHPRTAVAEVFQARRVVDVHRDEPWLVGFYTSVRLRLLDLTGLWPTRAGASTAISSGPRPRARLWSAAIHAAYPEAEGLWYGSSMAASAPCVALYERGEAGVPPMPSFHRALADPTLRAMLERYTSDLGYGLLL